MASRKFNIGRLNEQLMNENLFNAYNMVKYLGNGNAQPVQDRQAEILNGSLWNDTNENKNVLKAYNSQTGLWGTMFNGYYHPANMTVQPVDPVEGQLWIDGNGVLRYYTDLQWKVVYADTSPNATVSNHGLANFIIMPKLDQVEGYVNNYLVPSTSIGKLFENNNFLDESKYSTSNNVSIAYDSQGNTLTWIHVNPTFLYNAKKRLVRINKEGTDAYKINIATANTEFYGFKFGEPTGKLLTYIPRSYGTKDVDEGSLLEDTISDYVPVSGGIKLINNGATYD